MRLSFAIRGLHSRLAQLLTSRARTLQPVRRKDIRLAVESLEDRLAPAIFTVTTTADTNLNPTANSSQLVTLRDAITAVNADLTDSAANPDVIQFNIPFNDLGHVYYKDDQTTGKVSRTYVTTVPAGTTSDTDLANATIVGTGNTIDLDWQHSWWTITPQSALPTITNPAIINGYSQSGASPNTNTLLGSDIGDNAVLTIELSGTSLPASNNFPPGAPGLTITAGQSTVTGLVINGFVGGQGIALATNGGNSLVGNFFDTDASGTAIVANADFRHFSGSVLVGCSSNTIEGNVICNGKSGRGIIITGNSFFASEGASNNVVQGNYIGTNAAGNALLGDNYWPLWVQGNANDNRITENVIAGAVYLSPGGTSATGNVVNGNYIGTNAAGTAALDPNATVNGIIGVWVAANNTTISGNVIAGCWVGVYFDYNVLGIYDGRGSIVQDNLIGINSSGTIIPNGYGIVVASGVDSAVDADGVHQGPGTILIGGTTPGSGNTIAHNNGPGVSVAPGINPFPVLSTGVQIEGNSIYANGGLGIDLGGTGQVVLNDFLGHVGPNNYQNFPILNTAESGSSVLVSGTLNSAGSTTFTLDFYASPTADPSGYGEGQYYLGSYPVTTNASGNVSFVADLSAANVPGGVVPAGWAICATATDSNGNTSEFGPDVTAAVPTQTFSDFLQSALGTSPTLTLPANPSNAAAVVQAINELGPQTGSVSLFLNLAPGTYGGLTVNVPDGMTLYMNGQNVGPGTTIDPASPAFTITSGNVVVSNVTFVTNGDAPTILVTGGSLTLRNCVVQETTGFNDPAISLTSGTLDLGTSVDPGFNVIDISGVGQFIHNAGGHVISAVGVTYEINGSLVNPTPTIVVTGGSFTYNGQLHAASAAAFGVDGSSISGSFTFTYNGSPTPPTNAGTYAVVVRFTSSDTAYSNAVGVGSITINAAPFLVTANNTSKVYGSPNPAFTASYTGFVGGEGPGNLSGTLTFATSATDESAPGTYAAMPGGLSSSNYQLQYVAGSLTVQGNVARVVADPVHSGKSILLVGGTPGIDAIVIAPGLLPGTLSVLVNLNLNLIVAPLPGTTFGTVRAYGGAGDDVIAAAAPPSVLTEIFGGSGNDLLKGGQGSAIIVGGAGDDLLVGSSARDLLIGGTGADRIVGNAADDILVAGSTAYDGDPVKMEAIMQEWNSSASYAIRTSHLMGPVAGLNVVNGQSVFLLAGPTAAQATVFDDSSVDVLTGSDGQDWFLANFVGLGVHDRITDLSANEFETDLAFIQN